ncbi:MAG: ZIP family metal transporter [Alicyclobacillaceae bacterium]|nr:ZIP family metal transporter [Alicyclobacillaceae bacterium]
MLTVWLAFLLSVTAGLADVAGGMLVVWKRLGPAHIRMATALGTGFLLAATLLDRLPDAMAELPSQAPLYITAGYLALLLLDRHGAAHAHPPRRRFAAPAGEGVISRQAGVVALVGLLIHTFMDGVVIAGAFAASRAAGILMFIAITMHKLPEGFSMATIALAAGEPRRRALASAALLAASTVAGAGLTVWLGMDDTALVHQLMAVATGTFLFIATSGLAPVVQEGGRRAAFTVVIGAALFALSLSLVRHAGLA